MTRSLIVSLVFPLVLAACSQEGEDADAQARAAEPRGSYEIDQATGETFARYEEDDGSVTTMRSGRNVPVLLPPGFSLYPAAEVLNNTRVERDEGVLLSLDFTSPDPPERLVEFYRAEGEAAQFAIDVRLDAGPTRIIAGKRPDGDTLALLAVREGETTKAHLSIASGID